MLARIKHWLTHVHEWVKIDEIKVYGSEQDKYPIYRKHVLQCKFCGNIKKKNI